MPEATSGNSTAIGIAASPALVWQAIHELSLGDLRASAVLLAIRSLPARVRRRGKLVLTSSERPKRLLEAMTSGRFIMLHEEPDSILTMGVIGQFWKLSGGDDARIGGPDEFVDFDQPGFVKSAIDFAIEPDGEGTRLVTSTCNRATDGGADKRFCRYWRIVGLGSKVIRFDILRAVRRRAEAMASG